MLYKVVFIIAMSKYRTVADTSQLEINSPGGSTEPAGPGSAAVDHTRITAHRVLAGESRQAILALLESEDGPLDATEVGQSVGLHRNTARVHLELLHSIGLVRRTREHRSRPGRPRVHYEFVKAWSASGSQERSPTSMGYEELTRVLLACLEAGDDAADIARRAGRRWAESTPIGLRHEGALSADEAIRALADVLGRLGFDARPDPAGDRIVMYRCPFEDVAREHRSVVCAMHLGILQAEADRLASPVCVAGLDSFVTEDPLRCVVRLTSDPSAYSVDGTTGQARPKGPTKAIDKEAT